MFAPPSFLEDESFMVGSEPLWPSQTFNRLIYGEKRWIIKKGPGADEKSSECVQQRPGEVIWLPADWHHEVYCVEESFGVAVQCREMPMNWGHWLSLQWLLLGVYVCRV